MILSWGLETIYGTSCLRDLRPNIVDNLPHQGAEAPAAKLRTEVSQACAGKWHTRSRIQVLGFSPQPYAILNFGMQS